MHGVKLKSIPEMGFIPIQDKLPDYNELFKNTGPLSIEVGSGNGHFLADLSEIHKDRNYIGIEFLGKRIEKSCRKVKNRQIDNLKYIHGDAFIILKDMIADRSINEIFVNFSDPWPKYRHRKHRFCRKEFIDLLLTKLKNGGHIYWVSDFFPQIVEALSILGLYEKQGFIKNRFGTDVYLNELDSYLPTLYEKKWREEGRKIFYTCFEITGVY